MKRSRTLLSVLMGLYTDFYGQVRSQLLTQTPLPTLNRAYQQVTQEERVRGITQVKDDKPNVVGFAARPEGRGKGKMAKPDKSDMICTYCHLSGHDVAHCFELVGYPKWWGDRPRAAVKQVKSGFANQGMSMMHSQSGTLKAHAAKAGSSGAKGFDGAKGTEDKDNSPTPIPGFTLD
ncbi:unnamed protein product [Cuscuta epithymum]|uniref:Uncharacterized protein n=1 Tax=Cuscuta epithymum TaxID=186058 RepID=A0AAV0CXP3_9ASTE|nr:unnamed protein product [Cuscuta epithymum]